LAHVYSATVSRKRPALHRRTEGFGGFTALGPLLRRLLHAWQAELDAYTDWWSRWTNVAKKRDLPHWYNERTNIGFLAQALRRAFRDNVVVLEEFGHHKAKAARRGKARTALGRGDLWFSVMSPRLPRSSVYIEAKQAWPNLYAKKPGTAHAWMCAALKAARDVHLKREAAKRLGVVFYCPGANRAKWESSKDRRSDVRRWVASTLLDIRARGPARVAWATWFPASLPDAGLDYIYPGILVAIASAKP
jgi:hypothetical protein